MFTNKQLWLNVAILGVALIAGAGTLFTVYADTSDPVCPNGLITFYRDADSDTYGNPAVTTQACTQPDGYVPNSSDCNDADANVHPGATEICDQTDNDCDSSNNEGLATSTYYRDLDGDTYGGSATTTSWCAKPDGYSVNSTDCDDNNASIKPGAAEACNNLDDNCNGTIDESVKNTFYRDVDGDGYGNSASATSTCSAPSGYVGNSTDCNDSNSSVKPGANEACDGVDNDCDGTTDESCSVYTYYRDVDGDNYGNPNVTTSAATRPQGYATSSNDCNDGNSAIHPGATEICDSVDNDCDGNIDEDTQKTYYRDADGDGYGSTASTSSSCSAPSGYVTNSSDCNDNNSSIKPGATEACDGIDNNCNGTVDENCQNSGCNNNCGTSCGSCQCECKCTCTGNCNSSPCASTSCCSQKPGSIVSSISHCTNIWKWSGDITGKIKGQIMSQINKDNDNDNDDKNCDKCKVKVKVEVKEVKNKKKK